MADEKKNPGILIPGTKKRIPLWVVLAGGAGVVALVAMRGGQSQGAGGDSPLAGGEAGGGGAGGGVPGNDDSAIQDRLDAQDNAITAALLDLQGQLDSLSPPGYSGESGGESVIYGAPLPDIAPASLSGPLPYYAPAIQNPESSVAPVAAATAPAASGARAPAVSVGLVRAIVSGVMDNPIVSTLRDTNPQPRGEVQTSGGMLGNVTESSRAPAASTTQPRGEVQTSGGMLGNVTESSRAPAASTTQPRGEVQTSGGLRGNVTESSRAPVELAPVATVSLGTQRESTRAPAATAPAASGRSSNSGRAPAASGNTRAGSGGTQRGNQTRS